MSSRRPLPRRFPSRVVALATVVAALAAAPKPARAADWYFSGAGVNIYPDYNAKWSNYFNWVTHNVISGTGANNNVFFGYPNTSDYSGFDHNAITSNMDFTSIDVRALCFQWATTTLSGNTINLSYGINAIVPNNVINNHLNLLGNIYTFASSGNVDLRGEVDGVGGINKAGADLLVLTGKFHPSGGLYIGGGTVRLGSASAFGSASKDTDVQIAGGTLNTNGYDINVRHLFYGDNFGTTTGGIVTSANIFLYGNIAYFGNASKTTNAINFATPLTLMDGQHTISASYQSSGSNDILFTGGVKGTGGFDFYSPGIRYSMSGTNTYLGATNVAAGTLSLSGSNVLPTNTALAVNGTLYAYGSQTIGSLAGNGTVGVFGTLTINGVANANFSGSLDGSGLVKKGAGTQTLSGTNTYTGGTDIQAGRLIVYKPRAEEFSVANGATLEMNIASGTTDYTGLVPNVGVVNPGGVLGNGAFVKSGGGTLTFLTVFSNYTGGTTIDGGTLIPYGQAYIGSPNGSLDVNAAGTLNVNANDIGVAKLAGSGSIILGHNLSATSTADSTFSGIISSSGQFTKAGTGTLTLSGANTYTGGTKISAGKLIVTKPNGEYEDNAALEIANTDDRTVGKIGGSGDFVKSGAGKLSTGTTPTNTGTVTVSGGTFAIPALSRSIVDNSIVELTGTSNTTQSGVLTGTGSLLKSGSGTMTLGAGNTYVGNTITGGTLRLSSDTSLGTASSLVVSGSGTLDTGTANASVTSIAGDGTIRIPGGTLTVGNATDNTFTGPIIGNNDTKLVKNGAGTLTLTGNLQYTGLTTVNAGRLVEPKATGNYNLTGILELAISGTQTSTGLITGTGSLVQSGNGSLWLKGLNTYTGGTSIKSGSALTVSVPTGDYANEGSLEFNPDVSRTATGAIYGSGPVSKTGALDLTLSGANSFTGGLSVKAGTLNASSTAALGNGDVVLLGGILSPTINGVGVKNLIFGDGASTANGSVFGVGSLTLSGDLTLNNATGNTTAPASILSKVSLPSGTHTLSGNGQASSGAYDAIFGGVISGSGGLAATGQTFALNAANTYTGATAVNGGTLYATVLNALPSATSLTVAGGATLSLAPAASTNGVLAGNYSQTVAGLAGAGNILLGSATLTVNNSPNNTWDGVISGSGSLVKSGGGNLLLTGANSYTGGTIVTAGKLIVRQPTGTSYDDRARIEFNAPANTSASFAGTIFGVGGVDKGGAGDFTLSGTNTYTGGTNVIAGRLIVANPNGSYADGTALEFRNDAASTSTGIISGAGTLTKSGTGTLSLQGANTFTGGLQVKAGTVVADNPASFANGNLLLTGGNVVPNNWNIGVNNLTFGDAASTTIGNISGTGGFLLLAGSINFKFMTAKKTAPVAIESNISFLSGNHNLDDNGQRSSGAYDAVFSGGFYGTGGFTKTGSGIFAIGGTSLYSGATVINAGSLYAANVNALSPNSAYTVTSPGILSLNPTAAQAGVAIGSYSQTIGSLAGNGQVLLGAATLTTGGNNASTTFSGTLSGTGGLVKNGAGTLALTGNTTYTGGTAVNGGTLSVANPLGSYAVNGATLSLSSGSLSGTITGTGALMKTGTGTLTLSGANDYTGGTTISGGQLIASTPTGDYANAGILEFSNGSDTTAIGVISGGGSLVKSGAGTLTLSGANTYSGGTSIGAGRLVVLQPVGAYANNGILEVRNAGAVSLDGSKVTGTGSFAKSGAGTLTLTQKIAAGAGIEIKEGTLKATSSVLTGKSVVGDAGATLQLDTTGATFFSTDYSGEGNLLKSGSGRLILDGNLSNTGSTTVAQGAIYAVSAAQMTGLTVNAGALFLNDAQDTVSFSQPVTVQGEFSTTSGSTTVFNKLVNGAGGFSGFGQVQFNGGFSPGNSPAAVTLQGDMVLGAANDLTMELGGTTLGTGYDHLTVLGNAFLNGALDVKWYGGFTASLGQTFDLFDFAHSTGAFSSISLPTLGSGLKWNTSTLYADGKLSVQAVPEPATMAALGLGALVLLRRRKK